MVRLSDLEVTVTGDTAASVERAFARWDAVLEPLRKERAALKARIGAFKAEQDDVMTIVIL